MAIEALSNITRSGVGAFQAGGAASISATTVNIDTAVFGASVCNITDANALSTSSVIARLAPNDDWDADDLADFSLDYAAKNGSIDFVISRNGPIVGSFKIVYMLG